MLRALMMATFAAVLCLGLFLSTTQASELSTSYTDKLAKQTDSKPYESLAKALQSTFKKSDYSGAVKPTKSASDSKKFKSSKKSSKSNISSATKSSKSYAKSSKNYKNKDKKISKKAKNFSKKSKSYKTSYNKH
ncbi:MAG: hypothetical protein PHS86_03015 [Syntrophaceae bacterium]|nr:hypothetical protein [Syntrophaceae bacterium]